MAKPTQKTPSSPQQDKRKDRLRQQLRANLQRRKAQARARITPPSPQGKQNHHDTP